MPIRPNLIERAAFYHLNAAPAPMLDIMGMLGYQAVSTAARLNIFAALAKRPLTPTELAAQLSIEARGVRSLLEALETIGYVKAKNGRFQNSPMTQKWFGNNDIMDISAALNVWDVFLREMWPHATKIVETGKRPFDFYQFIDGDPKLTHSLQEMMVGNATVAGKELAKKVSLPASEARVLDVGGGHGVISIMLAEAFPQLQATLLDSEAALETAKRHIEKHHVQDRIQLQPGDMWAIDWVKNTI